MHTDLSPHLHTDLCNQFIEKLLKCREENTLGKYFGSCDSEYSAMRMCLRQERLKRTNENFANSAEFRRRQRVEAIQAASKLLEK